MSTVFKVSGQHLVITPALEDYARKKLCDKVTEIFPSRAVNIHVILSVEQKEKQQIAAIEVHVQGDQKPIVANACTNDMYKSIDALETKLLAQVRRYHAKLTNHHNKNKARRT